MPPSANRAWRRPRSTLQPSASSATSGHASTARRRRRSSNSKAPILAPLATGLPGGYRYLAVRDLAGEIEWAKARRIRPADYEMRAIADGRDAPLPPDLMARLYRDYESRKARAGRIDFEDMLELTIGLIETDATIAAEVRDRYRWFSVDEFQDTNPLQAALLDAWLGGRDDLAVVGDEDQTIYTFTGATSDYLIGFGDRYPAARIVRLETNYRSTPEVLALANTVLAAGRVAVDERPPGTAPRPPKRLIASHASGPAPEIGGFATDGAELDGIVEAVRALARNGTAHGSMAVLVRTNAQLPALEDAFGRAGIPFHVRGERFFSRPEVRRAVRIAAGLGKRLDDDEVGATLPARLADAFERELGVRRDTVPESETGGRPTRRRRHAARAGRGAGPHGPDRRHPDVPCRSRAAELGRGRWRGGRGRAADATTGPRASNGTPYSCPRSRRAHCRSASRPSRPSSPRSAGCSTSGSPGRGATCGCPGRRAGRARPAVRAGATARVSSMGWCRLRARPIVAVGPGHVPRERAPKVDPADRSPLSNALRDWRTARARADAVAPFIVFHDSTIEAIAASRPRSIAELRRVPGVGPMKLDRYGDEIISVVVRET